MTRQIYLEAVGFGMFVKGCAARGQEFTLFDLSAEILGMYFDVVLSLCHFVEAMSVNKTSENSCSAEIYEALNVFFKRVKCKECHLI